jgi:hypothetical protein
METVAEAPESETETGLTSGVKEVEPEPEVSASASDESDDDVDLIPDEAFRLIMALSYIRSLIPQ